MFAKSFKFCGFNRAGGQDAEKACRRYFHGDMGIGQNHSMHITVCVCTYKRPLLLAELIRGLISQSTGNLFSYSIIVVDNDYRKSAENTVSYFKKNSRIDIEYFIEEKQNVSLARNKAVNNAKGGLIAFIDDDEFPAQDWLLNLFRVFQKSGCSGVVGRINYKFSDAAPEWVKKTSFFNLGYKTGTILTRDIYTANVLLDRRLFSLENNYFLPEFGGGGEDSVFFYRSRKLGHNFIWCNEAVVHTLVPQERLEIKWLLRRALRYGTVDFKVKTDNRPSIIRFMVVFKSLFLIFASVVISAFSLILGKHKFYDCLFNAFFCAGIFLANYGYFINEYKAELLGKKRLN